MLDNIVFILTLNLNDLTVVWLTACILKQLIRTHKKNKNKTLHNLFREISLAVNGLKDIKYYFILSELNVIYTVHPSKKISTSWCNQPKKVSNVNMHIL